VIYSIDTCSLIEPWRKDLPRDVLPSLWEEHLPSIIQSGRLRATMEVRHEIERQDDELLEWVKPYADDLFVEINGETEQAAVEILRTHPKLIDPRSFRSGADPFVIALALSGEQCVVVTEENPKSQVNPKIPDVCSSYGIECIRLIDLIRREGWRFISA